MSNLKKELGNEVGPIGERIKQIIDHYRLNMNSFSVRLNLRTNSVISRVIKEPERGISMELMQKILFEFRDVSADWFVMGRGEMLRQKEELITEQPKPGDFRDADALLKQKDELIEALKTNNKDLRAYNKSLEDRVEALSNRVMNLQEIAGLPKKGTG